MRAKEPSLFRDHDVRRYSDVYYVCIITLYIIHATRIRGYTRNDVYDTYNRDTHRMYVYKNIRDSILR